MSTNSQGELKLNILLIECATDTALIAVSGNGKSSSKYSFEKTSHSMRLFYLIDDALKECGIVIGDIDLIGVGIGPGSFTGIRIAVSSARMLAQILRVPIVGVSTTLLYAASLDIHVGECALVAFDAKKNRIFGALYRKTESFYEELLPPGDYLPEELTATFPDHSRIIATGNGAERYKTILCAGELVADIKPDGVKGIAVVLHLYEQSPEKFLNYNSVIPCYARKSDAEVLHEAKSKSIRS
jgi:tRNA threonylcarbamoyladenosine biosynthesis protein TsaB